jgi:hypothetical protein
MAATIRLRADGRLLVCLDKDILRGGLDLVQKKLGPGRVKHMPAELIDSTFLKNEDALIACVKGTDAAKNISRLLNVRIPRQKAGGFWICPVTRGGGSVLVVAGGDRFGALAGLSEAIGWSEFAPPSFIYGGDERKETPAFPLRFYWTWDHSTNWVLDDPGNQVNGCNNPYLKKPETFLEDYRRLIDHAVDMRFNAVVVCGFFRDSHGAEAFAYDISRYGADRGVAVLPGVGITAYSGIYYEGEHPANLETFLHRNPDRGGRTKDGQPAGGLTPYRADNVQYIQRSIEWAATAFPIGGIYLENGDYLVDHSRAAVRARKRIPTGEEDFLKDQYAAYRPALEVFDRLNPDAWNIYATYCGFDVNNPDSTQRGLGGVEPYFARHMPGSAIAMWTLSGMLRKMPVALRDWMDDPMPAAAYDNPTWPRGLRPPTPRSAGFMHQGSQWSAVPRNAFALSSFAEGCLRAWESGLEGISIHGEVSSRTMTWLLNYLAMRHWTYHPKSTLKEFARAELAPRLGGEQAATDFIEALCLIEEGHVAEAREIARKYIGSSYSWRAPTQTLRALECVRMWMEVRWWACHPDSAVRMLPRISDVL